MILKKVLTPNAKCGRLSFYKQTINCTCDECSKASLQNPESKMKGVNVFVFNKMKKTTKQKLQQQQQKHVDI